MAKITFEGVNVHPGSAFGVMVNAALLAMEMLAISDEDLAKKLADKRAADTAAVLAKNAAVEAEFNK